jgi:hypothetical protein
MKIIFILVWIALSIGILCFFVLRKEGFADLDKTFLGKYNTFTTFYNTFQANWLQAITQSYAVDTGNKTGSTQDMNAYILRLSKTSGVQYPPLTDPLPVLHTTNELVAIQSQLPHDPVPFQHALDWMNTHLEETHAKLESTLQGIHQGFMDYDVLQYTESFDTICQQIATCQQQQTEQQEQQAVIIQQQMTPIFDSFLQLEPLLQKNTDLITKSKQIQDQASSGTLLPPVAPRVSPYTLPVGSNKLHDMHQNDPEKYAAYKQNYGQFIDMKHTFDQINGNLR